MRNFVKKLYRNDEGVTALEYALITLFIIVGIVAFVSSIGSSVSKPFAESGSAINGSGT